MICNIRGRRRWMWCFLTVVICAGIILLLNENFRSTSHYQIQVPNPNHPGSPDQKIVLIAWTGFPATYDYRDETAKICPKCIFTENLDYLRISDAVVFHGKHHSLRPPDIPRPKNQIWVWLFLEASHSVTFDMWSRHYLYSNLFNWTMTYRRDSDILLPYGRFFPFDKSSIPSPSLEEKWAYIASEDERMNSNYNRSLMPVPNIHDLKDRKMAAWIVSNCARTVNSRRHFIVEELSKYIQIDIYGDCGQFRCPSSRSDLNRGTDCRHEIASKYKFYLAFENNICEDYVTEKFFRTLGTQMVPVVYGGANYSAIAPKKSYISVTDFESIKDLADYLIYMDKNPAEYLKYFEWRKHYWVENYRFVSQFCALCDKIWSLTGLSNETKTYPDIIKWWTHKSDSHESSCQPPTKLKIVRTTWKSWWFWPWLWR